MVTRVSDEIKQWEYGELARDQGLKTSLILAFGIPYNSHECVSISFHIMDLTSYFSGLT